MFVSDTITTPLIEFFEKLGYSPDTSNGRKFFLHYGNTEEELNSLTDGVGLRDISDSGILELKGNDALDFLHRISTNSLRNLPKENVTSTIFTTEKGRIIDVTTVLNFDSQQLCITSSLFRGKVKSWLDKYIIADDVTLTDTGDKYALLELLGPQADSFVTLVGGNIAANLQPGTFKVLNSEGMLFFLIKFKDQNNRSRYWFISDKENGKQLINYMLDNKGMFNFSLIGEEAYNIYRIEQGIPSVPNEINDEHNPHEVKLMGFVDTKKGCYIGQEVIARLETYDKIQKVLAGVKLSTDIKPENTILVDETGAEAGKLTSMIYSPKCRKIIALAFIKRGFAAEGTELMVKDSNINATVKSLPFRK